MESHKPDDISIKNPTLAQQIPSLPQPIVSRLAPPMHQKTRTRSETSAEVGGRNTVLMYSPASPSRKVFKIVSSSVSPTGNRRGSEPVLDGMTRSILQQAQLSVTDRRWEKLRSILETMRNEPFDVDKMIKASAPELFNIQEKLSTCKEHFTLERDLSYLQDALKQKEAELQQAEAERDSALAYIRHLKTNLTDARNKPQQLYKKGIEGLKASTVSKENVIDMLAPLVKELHEQKSYLDCLMTVVLMRAPWMLDEVNDMELQHNQHFTSSGKDDVGEDDFQYENSDNEVWC